MDNQQRTSSSSNNNKGKNSKLTTALSPINFLDCHHHFYDTTNNEFQSFLGRFNPDAIYLPDDYHRDVIKPVNESDSLNRKGGGGMRHIGSVHVEAMPDDGVKEVQWLESLSSSSTSSSASVKAIVASCNLADENVDTILQQLKKTSPKVKGIRWILDYVGKVNKPGNEATHVANLRHDGVDYLRDGNGNNDGDGATTTTVVPEFERGFALLEKHQLTFDLQCAPAQLPAAAELCSRYPNIPVVIDHFGKPMQLLGKDNCNMMLDSNKLNEWRVGMEAMAALPNVYVKISMLGWILPNWITTARRVDAIKALCRETVELFGPERCMINTNWWKDGVMADSDGLGDVGPTAEEYLEYMLEFFGGSTVEELRCLFGGTAMEFYGIDMDIE